MNVTFITSPELLAQKFHIAAPLLQPVIDQAARGEFTLKDIERMTAEGKVITAVAELDGVGKIAMAFEFVHYPQTLAVNVMALGGSGLDEAAAEFWDAFKSWCKDAGASVIEASCSDAMARMLGRIGFETVYRVVRAEL
jgi:hypothetical protein